MTSPDTEVTSGARGVTHVSQRSSRVARGRPILTDQIAFNFRGGVGWIAAILYYIVFVSSRRLVTRMEPFVTDPYSQTRADVFYTLLW